MWISERQSNSGSSIVDTEDCTSRGFGAEGREQG